MNKKVNALSSLYKFSKLNFFSFKAQSNLNIPRKKPYFLEPIPEKNLYDYLGSDHLSSYLKNKDFHQFDDDYELVIDIEKFNLKEYLLFLLNPNKPKSDKDEFPFTALYVLSFFIFHLISKKISFYFKDPRFFRPAEETNITGPNQDISGRTGELGFQYVGFKKVLNDIKIDFEESLNNLQ